MKSPLACLPEDKLILKSGKMKPFPPSALEDELILKSNYPLNGITFDIFDEVRTFFRGPYVKKGKIINAQTGLDWYKFTKKHTKIHNAIACELCLAFRKFKQSRNIP